MSARQMELAAVAMNPLLHEIDYEDVALSIRGVGLVRRAAQMATSRWMPATRVEKLTLSQALSLFLDKVFWEERSGGLLLCGLFGETGVCLPIPREDWTLRGADEPLH